MDDDRRSAHDDEGQPHGHHPHLRERLGEWEDAAIAAEMATGRREETVEEARRSLVRRVGTIVAGSVVLALGLALLVLPGPGLIVTAAGLGILAVEVPFAARWLEKVRARLPEGEDGEVSKKFLAVSIAIAVLFLGISSYVSWMKFTNESWDIPIVPLL